MRRLFSFAAAVAAMVAGASCTKEEAVVATDGRNDVVIALDMAREQTKAIQDGFREGNTVYVYFNNDLDTKNTQERIRSGCYLKMVYDGETWQTEISSEYLNSLPETGIMNAIYISSMEEFTMNNYWVGPSFYPTEKTLSNGETGYGNADLMIAKDCSYEIRDGRMTGTVTLERKRLSYAGHINLQVSVSGLPDGEWYFKAFNISNLGAANSSTDDSKPCTTDYNVITTTKFLRMSELDGDMVAYGKKAADISRGETWELELYDNATDRLFVRSIPAGSADDPNSLLNLWDRNGKDYNITNTALKMSFSSFTEKKSYKEIDKEGKANCYVLTKGGSYSFDASTRGNGWKVDGIGLSAYNVGATGAKLLWQSSRDMISDVYLEDWRVFFTASQDCGNAVIAVTDKDGSILWSWHIWHPETEIAQITTINGWNLMNINLGAINDGSEGVTPDCYGMLYQWGRKDPFPGSPVLTGDTSTMPRTVYDEAGKEVNITHTSWYSTKDNTLEYAIAHPEAVISNYYQYSTSRDWLADGTGNDGLWGNPEGKQTRNKTMFDPCPPGWSMPHSEALIHATTSGGYTEAYSSFNVVDINSDKTIDAGDFTYGWTLYMDKYSRTSSFFPAAGRYDGSYAMLYGSIAGLWGAYWSNAPYESSSKGLASAILTFSGTQMSAKSGGSRADAYSVRCCR